MGRAVVACGAALVVALAAGCRGQQQGGPPSDAARLYNTNCATCHGPSGQGVGEFPKIVGADKILNGDYARTVIAEGRNKMPAFAGTLTAAQIAEIVAYVATFPT
jgi:mono/diheme cytochrome c family protein